MRLGSKAKKKKVTPGDIFMNKATKKLYRVTKSSAEVNGNKHAAFGDLLGAITARPFITTPGIAPQHVLAGHGRHDIDIMEHNHLYMRPGGTRCCGHHHRLPVQSGGSPHCPRP